MFDGEEKANILEKMVSCVETFRNLTNSLIGSAEGLSTSVGLLQSTSSADVSVQQQTTENTDAVCEKKRSGERNQTLMIWAAKSFINIWRVTLRRNIVIRH